MVAMARAAVCLCLWLAVSQVRGSYSRQEMNRTIQNLLQHYNIPIKEIFNGKLVFPRELPSGKIEEKMVYMSGVLETYEHLIDHMLKQLPAPSHPKTAANGGDGTAAVVTPATGSSGDAAGGDVREQLTYILDKVQKLRTHRYREQNQLLQALQALGKVQMKNSIIQSKALWELPWLYEEASSLPDNLEREKQKRRRRRQAQRVKTRQRA